ncbi:tfiiic subunit sfc7 [Schizosaccharomyces japonicus yFS275]|uniref:Tfiiic subunit sfc7 n=1 Tax=Schizosaccharomyces japonicus (strain yFS275 / FY16936) TaxID=402676 RepID=B6K7R1_SCHJY|nr:tfiiic subunit sfc7 [Schizosaccharomyces japonicus yFS275]EEB09565.1 tfiiic subunit sfc7 [Schizosaccharomyces japonicus yFS275]
MSNTLPESSRFADENGANDELVQTSASSVTEENNHTTSESADVSDAAQNSNITDEDNDSYEDVVFDFGANNTDVNMAEDITVLGLDEEHPIIRVGAMVFRGTWHHTIGTDLHVPVRTDGNLQTRDILPSSRHLVLEQIRLIPKGSNSKNADADATLSGIVSASTNEAESDMAVDTPDGQMNNESKNSSLSQEESSKDDETHSKMSTTQD